MEGLDLDLEKAHALALEKGKREWVVLELNVLEMAVVAALGVQLAYLRRSEDEMEHYNALDL